jgi:hypothetical protein
MLTRDRDPILWDFDTPHPPGGMITTPDGANIHAADSSCRMTGRNGAKLGDHPHRHPTDHRHIN